MTPRKILHLNLSHDYYQDQLVPVRVAPFAANDFRNGSLGLHRSHNRVTVWAMDEAVAPPDWLSFAVEPESPDFSQVTEGFGGQKGAQLQMPRTVDGLGLADATMPVGGDHQQMLFEPMLRLDLQTDPEGVQSKTLSFDAPDVYWCYHLIGVDPEATLEIVDPIGNISFAEQIGVPQIGGRTQRVFLANSPIPARVQYDRAFGLQQGQAFGPKTLIPHLPAALSTVVPIYDQHGGRVLKAEIYVTLF